MQLTLNFKVLAVKKGGPVEHPENKTYSSAFARMPPSLRQAPPLAPLRPPRNVEPRSALLVNPFYSKDPHSSFGKHVLTPTLALTSIAGATPEPWTVRYWDENLCRGRRHPTRPASRRHYRAPHLRAARL